MRIKSARKLRLDNPIKLYDIEVPETSNFAISAGVYVHNSSGFHTLPKKCLTGDTKIYFPGNSIMIRDLIGHKEFPVISYDINSEEIVVGTGRNCRITDTNRKIVRAYLSNGGYFDCTPDHWVLTTRNTYIPVSDAFDVPLRGVTPYIGSLKSEVSDFLDVFFITEIVDLGYQDVYDIEVDKYHNFLLDCGLYVHNSEVKRMYTSRWSDEGGIFMAPDASQLELRVTAAISGEPGWIEAYENDMDLHQATAAAMFDKPFDEVTKDERNIGKCVCGDTLIDTNFGRIPISNIVPSTTPSDEVTPFYDRSLMIKTLDGYRPIESVYKVDNVELLHIELSNGKFIRCTPNHRFVIDFDGTMPVLKMASDLTKSDNLFTDRFDGIDINNINVLDKLQRTNIVSISVVPGLHTAYDLIESKYRLFFTNSILTEDTNNFSILYGSGPESMSTKLHISVAQAEEYLDKYRSTIPYVQALVKKQEDFAVKNGYIWNMFNRYMPVPDAQSDNWGIRGHGLRQSFNFLIQSSSSDVITTAATEMYEDMKRRGMRSLLLATVHDSIETDCYPGELIQMVNLYKYYFEERPRELYNWLKCPMKISIDFGTSWGSSVEVDKIISLDDRSFSYTGTSLRKNIVMLQNQASKAYNFDYEILSRKEINPDELGTEQFIKDTEIWDCKIHISEKRAPKNYVS